HEEPAEAVDRAEQDQEVAGLQTGRPVTERDRRDQQREPAQPEREQELVHELAAVRVRRPQRRHDRLAGEDHHVPHLLEQVLGRQERPVCYRADHGPDREVSPKATMDPFPYCCGAGGGGGPTPTATYTAPPTVAMPP